MVIPPPTEPLDDAEMRWYNALWHSLADPPWVTAVQIMTGLLKFGTGLILLWRRPDYIWDLAGGVPAAFICIVLMAGGVLAAWCTYKGFSEVEEFGLRLAQVGLIGVFTVFTIILWDNEGRSFLVTLLGLLIGMAILDAEKRIRRLRWDRVHPLSRV